MSPLRAILDPTHEKQVEDVEPTKRASGGPAAADADAEIEIGPIGLMDISKPQGNIFLDHIESKLKVAYPGVVVNRYCKHTVTMPAKEELRRQMLADGNRRMVCALAD